MHVDEANEHGERTEQQRNRLDADPSENAVDGARERRVGTENDHPRVDANQEVAPERQDHEEQQQVAILL